MFFSYISFTNFFYFICGVITVYFSKKPHGNVIVFHLFFQERLFVLDQLDTHENKGIYLVFQFLVSKKVVSPTGTFLWFVEGICILQNLQNIRAFNKRCSCACGYKYFLRSTPQKTRFLSSFSWVCPWCMTNLLCHVFE